MSRGEHQRTLLILNEIKQLVETNPDLLERLENVLTVVDFKQNIDGNLHSPELHLAISPNLHNKELFDGIPSEYIPYLFVQYLLIHFYLSKNSANPVKLSEIETFVNECPQLNEFIEGGQGYAKVVIYQELFKRYSWEAYLDTCRWDWTDITMLDESIISCNITYKSICRYLTSARLEHPNDLAVEGLGKNLIEKIRIEPELKKSIVECLESILTDQNLRTFLPSFIRGLITSHDEFLEYFEILSRMLQRESAFAILYALGAACPDSQPCFTILRETIRKSLNDKIISKAEFIRLHTIRNYEEDEILNEVYSFSREASEIEEVIAIYDFVANNLKSDKNRGKIYDTILNIVRNPDEKLITRLEYLIHQLIKSDIAFTYQLLGSRFESLGGMGFPINCWRQLVNTDQKLFSVNLTYWLNSDNPNVHRALLKLCSSGNFAIRFHC